MTDKLRIGRYAGLRGAFFEKSWRRKKKKMLNFNSFDSSAFLHPCFPNYVRPTREGWNDKVFFFFFE